MLFLSQQHRNCDQIMDIKDLLSNIGSGIISGLIATGIIMSYHYFCRHFLRRRIRHLIWRKCPPAYRICVIYPVFVVENNYRLLCFNKNKRQKGSPEKTIVDNFVAESEVLAYRFIVNLLNSAKIEHKLESDFESNNNYWQGDILSLGLSNSESERILAANRLISVEKGDWIIKGREEPIMPSDDPYGMILRTTVNGRTRLLCGGFNDFGTVGATRVFSEQNNKIIHILNKYYFTIDPFAFLPRPDFLIIVKGENNYSNNFGIVEVWTIGWWKEPVMLYRDKENSVLHAEMTVKAATTTTTTM